MLLFLHIRDGNLFSTFPLSIEHKLLLLKRNNYSNGFLLFILHNEQDKLNLFFSIFAIP